MDAVLTCSDLHKSFGERAAVAGVGFEVQPGETYGLLGPNGAGKTTTISMIAGLLERDAGSITVAGASGTSGDRPPVVAAEHAASSKGNIISKLKRFLILNPFLSPLL